MFPRTDPRAGFMLIEVLAALLLTASLVSIILPFAGQLIGRWQTGWGSGVQADAWMLAIERLSDDIAQSLPIHDPQRPQVLVFTVGPKAIDLVRPALGQGIGGGLELVSYRVESMQTGERLVRRARPMAGTVTGPETKVVMLEGAYAFRFSAVGPDGVRAPWGQSDKMPVRLDLAVTATDRSRTPFSPVILPIAARALVAKVVPLLRQVSP